MFEAHNVEPAHSHGFIFGIYPETRAQERLIVSAFGGIVGGHPKAGEITVSSVDYHFYNEKSIYIAGLYCYHSKLTDCKLVEKKEMVEQTRFVLDCGARMGHG